MQTSMYVPPLTKINKLLISTVVALFLLNAVLGLLANTSIVPWLGLSWIGLKNGLIYQPLTFALVESSFLGVIFNCLLVWFIGSDLEVKWGTRFYIKYLVICVMSSAVLYIITSALGFGTGALTGMGGITYALLVAYGLIYSDRLLTFMLIFPMKAKYFCMILAGMQLYLSVFSANRAIALVHLSAMLVGFIYLNLLSMRARGKGIGSFLEKRRKEKTKKSLYIVPSDGKQKANPKDPKFWQ